MRQAQAYYNEHDPKAAAWLRELVKEGRIAPGYVDETDIRDVLPGDLLGFAQCHFFAGIGVWSHALRQAGWSDDRPVWTGSCPCQPFSQAGRGKGAADERHLWPHWYHLIEFCRPRVIFGEQVASKAGLGWLDLVQADLEGARYTSGAVDICAAGVGAPHIRQRLYFGAERMANPGHLQRATRAEGLQHQPGASIQQGLAGDSADDGMANSAHEQRHRAGGRGPGGWSEHTDGGGAGGLDHPSGARHQDDQAQGAFERGEPGRTGATDWLEHTDCAGPQQGERPAQTMGHRTPAGGMANPAEEQQHRSGTAGEGGRFELANSCAVNKRAGPTNGFWRTSDWLGCRDGKWRAVEPGTFPLADGAPARVGRLCGYGNALCAPVAQAFIETYMEKSHAESPE